MASMNSERREAWIFSVQNDNEFIESKYISFIKKYTDYKKGVIPILHNNNYRYRDFNTTGFTTSTGNHSYTSIQKANQF